ncbi:hypothetical protein G6011_06531 [Alternaria panax]|uniref:Uncharacterized protein n=1 Tax=Alternaria panax TaxID=48097 RepID=A0AAD4FIM0_9PLEO|nr:hypothetical protein G6011_06531 [Alternaria panax]
MAIGLRSHSTFSFAELHYVLHQRTCGTTGCTNTVKYINMKTLVRICDNCFYPSVWPTFERLAFTYNFIRNTRTNEHAEDNEKAVTPFKMRMNERVGFVEVGALKRRGRGIEGSEGKRVSGGELDSQ